MDHYSVNAGGRNYYFVDWLDAVVEVAFDYYSRRSRLARSGWRLRQFSGAVLALIGAAFLAIGTLLLLQHMVVGWSSVGLAVVPFMILVWSRDALRHLPNGAGNAIDQVLSGDVLGQLPQKPTPQDVALAVGRVTSGQFMGARFGLTPKMLGDLAESEAIQIDDVWRRALETKDALGLPRLTASILVVALVRSFSGYENILAQIHLDDTDLDEGILWQQHLRDLVTGLKAPKRTGGIARDWSFGFMPLLDRLGRNITDEATRSGGLLVVDSASHVEAVDRLVDVLGSGHRNVALVGKTGSGKTTIIHALADRMINTATTVPETLRFHQVILLDPSSLIASAHGRDGIEELMIRIINEASASKNCILCLDNAELFFTEGPGSVDIGNILQPILESGNPKMVLSMDEQRFLQISQRNPALVASLERINVAPSDQLETMRIMQEQLILTEIEYKVTYRYQALKEAYRLSERYMHDFAMPGRAMTLLTSAASYHDGGLVTMDSVQRAIEKTTGVKVGAVSEGDERDRLLNMETLIHKRMVNQDRAVQVVSDALRRARSGVGNKDRPIGTFLFLGPTGVGKTELSKALAEVYYGGEDRLIRVDLNEYVQSSDVDRLIADGAEDPSSLTARVMKRPFSVILLDEIEKAAPEVLSTLLQMLDEGILRDIKNREVSFRDAIVIATSNAGAERIRELIDRGYQLDQFEQQITDELIQSGQFRPEFLNRFDEIVIFRPFAKEELVQVLDLMLEAVNASLASQKITVSVSDEAKQILMEKGYDSKLGARPMRRVVQRAVENTVAKLMLEGSVHPGDTIAIDRAEVERALERGRAQLSA